MARALLFAAVVAAVAFASVPSASAIAQLCNPQLTPAAPTNVRVKSNVWNGKNAEIVIQWDNPTTEKTGCVQQFRVEYSSTKAWQAIDQPLQSPVSYKFLANAGQKVEFKVAAYNKGAEKYSSYTSLKGGLTAVSAPQQPGTGGPIKLCTQGVVPLTPTGFKVKSNVYNPSTKNSEILLEWTAPTDPSGGCVKMFTIQSTTTGGGMKDNTMAVAGQERYTKLRLANPGGQTKYEIVAVGTDDKVSGKAVINGVLAAGPSVTATPYSG